jgi:protein-L-isoaspartate(D-aspartate) O-methyltransferase
VERLEAHRHFYADLITTAAGAAKNERLKAAFASTPREHFVGAGPWKVFAGGYYVETPTDDPAFLYQDVVVALAFERRINNGQPVLHAINLAALDVKQVPFSHFQPTTQPTKRMSYMNFRVLWQSPRSCMLL